jgi:hypothetical protein
MVFLSSGLQAGINLAKKIKKEELMTPAPNMTPIPEDMKPVQNMTPAPNMTPDPSQLMTKANPSDLKNMTTIEENEAIKRSEGGVIPITAEDITTVLPLGLAGSTEKLLLKEAGNIITKGSLFKETGNIAGQLSKTQGRFIYKEIIQAMNRYRIDQAIKARILGKNIKKIAFGYGGRSTKEAILKENILRKVFGSANLWKGLGLASLLVGQYGWGEWAGIEGQEAMSMAYNEAIASGDDNLINEVRQEWEEMLNPGIWSELARLLPIGTLGVGFTKKLKGIQTLKLVNDKIAENEKASSLMSKESVWDLGRKEEEESEKRRVDYFNEKRIRTEEEIRNAELLNQTNIAELWRKQKAELREDEKKARDEDAEFWFQYKKRVLELEKMMRGKRSMIMSTPTPTTRETPSRLNFGILGR